MNTSPRSFPDTPDPRPSGRTLRPVPGHRTPGGRLDAGGARLRLRALHVMGHGAPRLARALRVRKTAIQELVSGKARTISPHLRDAITDLYEAWWDKRAPERTRAERAAAAAARRRAIAGNWCAAAALDDDQLDIPGYRPATAGNPPPAPASPPASARPPAATAGGRAHEGRPDRTRPVRRCPGRAGPARVLPR